MPEQREPPLGHGARAAHPAVHVVRRGAGAIYMTLRHLQNLL